jgi:hypothetical protein
MDRMEQRRAALYKEKSGLTQTQQGLSFTHDPCVEFNSSHNATPVDSQLIPVIRLNTRHRLRPKHYQSQEG